MPPVKLRKLHMRGFRGARFLVPVDFTSDHRSIAIFGENAGGKSTLTDAIEWFVTAKVEHLWRDECREEALRNVLLDATEPSEVAVEFSSAKSSGIRSLSTVLKASLDNKSPEFQSLLKEISSERVFLRHAQITNFVSKTKSEKKAEIADIIGFEAITGFRDNIQSALNALRRDSGYVGARQFVDEAQAELMRIAGRMITSEEGYLEAVNQVIEPFALGISISDPESFLAAQRALQAKITHPDRAKQLSALDQVRSDCETIQIRTQQFQRELGESFSAYNILVKDKNSVRQLNIEQFLVRGRAILDEGHFTDQHCPFCLTPFDLSLLVKEVGSRIGAIAELREKYEGARNAQNKFARATETLIGQCVQLQKSGEKLDGFQSIAQTAEALGQALEAWNAASSAAFGRFDEISPSPELGAALGKFASESSTAISAITEKFKALDVSEAEEKLLHAVEQLNSIRSQFVRYAKNRFTVQLFETHIDTLQNLFSEFVPIQNQALQNVLDQISKDVGAYYARLHPDEEVDQVRLVIVGEEGVEFEYRFHGVPCHPPLKFLSESHLNSLGICLFLASAKLFNKTGRFLILDDILTSFDLGHRRRLIRLLKEEFADWQIVLLTHERVWYDIIKKELKQAGWLFKEVECDPSNGIQISVSPNDLKSVIVEKRKKYDVSNDLRKLCEATLKEICRALGVKVAFRFNEENEARMSGELLSELNGAVNRKCPSLKGNPTFTNLEGSNLIINVGSHDNPTKEIVGGDIDVALSDIAALDSLFRCGACGRHVETDYRVAGTQKISCKCGKKELEWKQ